MSRGFDAFCTRDEARQYFHSCGLTYDDISEGDILILIMLVQQELKKSNKNGETSVNTMSLSKRVNIKKKTNGRIITCFIYMNSHYFLRREAISFNADGFISFSGWADQGNTNPLLRAFKKWCDYLTNTNDEGGHEYGKQ